MRSETSDYGEVTEFPQAAKFGATCTKDGVQYVRRLYRGWVAFEQNPFLNGSDASSSKNTDFGGVAFLPSTGEHGDTCWYKGDKYKFYWGGVCWVKESATKVFSGLEDAYDGPILETDWKKVPPPYKVQDTAQNNGGSTSYYDIPEGAKTLNDLIEHKDMRFWQGECMKAIYALTDRAARATDGSSSEERELNKIIYYANRGLAQLGREKECQK